LNDELMEVSLKLRERDRLRNNLKKNRDVLADKTKKLTECGIIMEKEGKDLKKYESLSLTGLFHTILGNKEEQLEKERQEFLAAKLKYDETKTAVKDLETGISGLIKELAAYGEVDDQYNRIMRAKETYIIEHNDENSNKLMDLIEELAGIRSSIKEIKEAMSAGHLVKEKLQQMIGSLESAGNWGTWDMLGGGFLATAVKHSRIDDARSLAYDVQKLLREFRYELEDVDAYIELDVNIGSFETFADYFFDGLISDWIVQSRINDSLNNSLMMRDNIDDILSRLSRKLDEAQKKSVSMEQEKKHIIEEL